MNEPIYQVYQMFEFTLKQFILKLEVEPGQPEADFVQPERFLQRYSSHCSNFLPSFLESTLEVVNEDMKMIIIVQ